MEDATPYQPGPAPGPALTSEQQIRMLASQLADGASLGDDGAPWHRLAEDLTRLHAEGFTLHDLAQAVRADLAAVETEG